MEYSAQEICDLVSQATAKQIHIDLPSSKSGVKIRAEKEGWKSRIVQGKGGRNGQKTVYSLPNDVIKELQAKGLIPLLEKSHLENKVENQKINEPPAVYLIHQTAIQKRKSGVNEPAIPLVMQDMVNEYDIWSEGQDVSSIVPVRYHTNLFGRAGHGERFDEQLITEAMWFRASFFDVLGVSPDKCFCSRIKGDSMEPTLIDRGTVLWQMTADYLGEGIYLFRQYDDIRIKRLHRINRYTYRIVSDSSNKDSYPTEILDLSQSQDYDFEIYGKYLWDCGIAP